MNDLTMSESAAPIGLFHAVKTADAVADARDGHAYYALNALGLDTSGDELFEIRFGDGEWMLALEADLTPLGEHALSR